MIVVTGPTGKLGKLVVEELALRLPADEIGISVREPKKAVSFAERGMRVRRGDFAIPETLADSFAEASQLLIISSNAAAYGGDPLAQHRAAIEAAKAAGVQRIVYTSQIASSAVSAFSPARDHAATEMMLAESGVAWTALRNGFYADSALMFMGPTWRQGMIAAPADGRVAWTSHSDLAAAAAAILCGVKIFDGATPPLTGTESLHLAGLASLASALVGIPIGRTVLRDEDFKAGAKQRGLPEGAIKIAMGYYEASRRGEFDKAGPALEELIGRRPKTMREVLEAATGQSGS